MAIRRETIKAIIKDYNGFDLSEEELDVIEEGLAAYDQVVQKMGELELADVVSARVMQAKQGGDA